MDVKRSARNKTIGDFLEANPQFCRAEWDSKFEDLTVWFTDNPNEPMSISEFIRNTPTWRLMDELANNLRACDE